MDLSNSQSLLYYKHKYMHPGRDKETYSKFRVSLAKNQNKQKTKTKKEEEKERKKKRKKKRGGGGGGLM